MYFYMSSQYAIIHKAVVCAPILDIFDKMVKTNGK